MIWFTSDLHFWHKNVISFCNRPWPDVEAMNAGLISLWNQTVQPEDTVYILGDMFFCGTIALREIMRQLNGKKVLIFGNHDWGKIKKHRLAEFGFAWGADQFCTRIGKHDVLLSHFPYLNEGDHTDEQRFQDKRYVNEGRWLLHGHVHCLWKQKDRMINVGVDVWDYRPVSQDQILQLIEAQ